MFFSSNVAYATKKHCRSKKKKKKKNVIKVANYEGGTKRVKCGEIWIWAKTTRLIETGLAYLKH